MLGSRLQGFSFFWNLNRYWKKRNYITPVFGPRWCCSFGALRSHKRGRAGSRITRSIRMCFLLALIAALRSELWLHQTGPKWITFRANPQFASSCIRCSGRLRATLAGISSECPALRSTDPAWHRRHGGHARLWLTLTKEDAPWLLGVLRPPWKRRSTLSVRHVEKAAASHTAPVCRGLQRAALKRANMNWIENMLCSTFFVLPLKKYLLTAAGLLWNSRVLSQKQQHFFF